MGTHLLCEFGSECLKNVEYLEILYPISNGSSTIEWGFRGKILAFEIIMRS